MSSVDNCVCACSLSAPQVMLDTAKNEATRTADCANSRHWSGSRRPHSAKNGSD